MSSESAAEKHEKDDAAAGAAAGDPQEGGTNVPDCSVCLQTCVHPVRLPCTHVFCFLCVKGVAMRSQGCALCRRTIPPRYFDNPTFVQNNLQKTDIDTNAYTWFYEGRNGWWQYEERASAELEQAFTNSESECRLLIAGFIYTVDFNHMLQYRHQDTRLRRRVKRDLACVPKKGVAGIKTNEQQLAAAPPEAALDAANSAAEHLSQLSLTSSEQPRTVGNVLSRVLFPNRNRASSNSSSNVAATSDAPELPSTTSSSVMTSTAATTSSPITSSSLMTSSTMTSITVTSSAMTSATSTAAVATTTSSVRNRKQTGHQNGAYQQTDDEEEDPHFL